MNWMYSCRKVAELLSQSLDEPLELRDRIHLRVHLSMCSSCRNVEQHLNRLKSLSADLFSTHVTLDDQLAPLAGSPNRQPPPIRSK